jgi:hypothetical protein
MPSKALTGTILPSGQTVPRDRVGDKKGYYPEPSKATGKAQAINLVTQVLRHGKQGMSSVNWDMFGAKGSKGKTLRDKRPNRIQNSPVPHTRELKGVRFDARSGKFIATNNALNPKAAKKPLALSELETVAKRNAKPVSPYARPKSNKSFKRWP